MNTYKLFNQNLFMCCKGVNPPLTMVIAGDNRTRTVHDHQNRASIDVRFDAAAENKVSLTGHPSVPILNVVKAALEITIVQLKAYEKVQLDMVNPPTWRAEGRINWERDTYDVTITTSEPVSALQKLAIVQEIESGLDDWVLKCLVIHWRADTTTAPNYGKDSCPVLD